MPNICLTISYDGTRYAGWQIQKKGRTIQGEIERVLKRVFKERVKLIGAGRTDAGVHAKAHVAHFRIKKDFPLAKLKTALNAHLPDDIRITGIKQKPAIFHSQFNAKSKIYKYTILNDVVDNPFLRNFYYRVPYKLNVPLMREEARVLKGTHDFKSFQAKNASFPDHASTVRVIKKISVKKQGRWICIDIEANGFLYNMARNIVGTLVEIGRGYLPKGSMKKILRSKERTKAGPTAPAKGLMLIKVIYPQCGFSATA